MIQVGVVFIEKLMIRASVETEELMRLLSADDQEFTVSRPIMEKCVTIRNILPVADVFDDSPLPLPNVRGEILRLVIEFCHHDDLPIGLVQPPQFQEEDRKRCNINKLGQDLLTELMQAAHYLDHEPLLQLCKYELMVRSMELHKETEDGSIDTSQT
eukprot:TRINITY_DN3028_c0_g1_i1.p1 TRINITY_DN3028_c0_g1~~TRINITY_DN3028_c0_g1_i1.p1  ORF type:complete len:166 (-),score=20.58 TRINITY_DN3028_c0_g1_i1:391-861(-)